MKFSSFDISSLSDRVLAGQRLMAGFDGTCLNDDLKHLIRDLCAGGIILFSRNLDGPDEIRDLCRSAMDYAAECGLPPLFIAIDQEGGQVARLKEPFTIFPGNPSIEDLQAAVRFAEITACELKYVGINMNFAPVLDVSGGTQNSIMAQRTFPGGPETVGRLGRAVIETLQANGILAVGKHFPGIGRTTFDSHVDQPVLETGPDDLERLDLPPFREAIAGGVSGIMLSHIRYTGVDKDVPASMSRVIAHDLLRKKMGFNGLVMTDDLDMGAVTRHYRLENVIDAVDGAGIDIVLVCHAGPARQRAVDRFLELLQSSDKHREQAMRSVERIMRTKAAL